MRLIHGLLGAAVLIGAWQYFASSTVEPGPGILVPGAPVQSASGAMPILKRGDIRLEAQASFALEARVLGVEPYRLGREAALSPVDLALGWGPMSDSAVLAELDIRQGNRFYHYRWQGEPPIPRHAIVEHSANMHLIPADDTIRQQLMSVRAGQVVRLRGYLVRARADDGWYWNTSMTRSDSGAGACELVWVTAFGVR